MGDIYFKRLNLYCVNPSSTVAQRSATLIGQIMVYLPKCSTGYGPTSGVIVRNTLLTSKWDELSAWCPDITLATAHGMSRSDAIINPSLRNYFTEIAVTSNAPTTYIAWENPENGCFMMPSLDGNLYGGWVSKESFLAHYTRDFAVAPVGGNASVSSSNGSGTAELPMYRSVETVTVDDQEVEYFKEVGYATIEWTQAGLITITYNRGNIYTNQDQIDGFNRFWGTLQKLAPGGGDDPYDNLPTGGDEPIPGGGAVPEPGLPGLSAASTGIMGLFCPSVAQMQQLSDFMWTDFGGQGTTVIEVLEEIVEAIKRAISNPLDYIFGLNIIPSQGLSIGASKVVKFGFVSSGVSMPVLSDHYFIVDCGSVAFDVLCGDSFLDYAPYSKFSIYLPYIGFKDIDPNDCVGHTISVKYHGDAITGGLTAYVFKDGNVMYQYSGGCALNVPLSADNWGATIASAASIATGVISAAASGGAAGVGAAAAKGAASVAANPSLLSPQVMHSGAVSGAPGFMGVQYPFIIREAVNFHSTAGFNKESGYPAYYYKALSEVTGFTTVLDPHINNIPQATQGEMVEIISLLESGVIL